MFGALRSETTFTRLMLSWVIFYESCTCKTEAAKAPLFYSLFSFHASMRILFADACYEFRSLTRYLVTLIYFKNICNISTVFTVGMECYKQSDW